MTRRLVLVINDTSEDVRDLQPCFETLPFHPQIAALNRENVNKNIFAAAARGVVMYPEISHYNHPARVLPTWRQRTLVDTILPGENEHIIVVTQSEVIFNEVRGRILRGELLPEEVLVVYFYYANHEASKVNDLHPQYLIVTAGNEAVAAAVFEFDKDGRSGNRAFLDYMFVPAIETVENLLK